MDLVRSIDGPVLMHCASGNRVGSLFALGARREGLDADAAFAVGEKGRPHSLGARPLRKSSLSILSLADANGSSERDLFEAPAELKANLIVQSH